jgi:hypothetical protein
VRDLKVWIDEDNLLEYLGGTSKGTLLDDIGPWSDPSVLAKLGYTVPGGGDLPPIKASLSRVGSEVEDGYATPRCGLGRRPGAAAQQRGEECARCLLTCLPARPPASACLPARPPACPCAARPPAGTAVACAVPCFALPICRRCCCQPPRRAPPATCCRSEASFLSVGSASNLLQDVGGSLARTSTHRGRLGEEGELVLRQELGGTSQTRRWADQGLGPCQACAAAVPPGLPASPACCLQSACGTAPAAAASPGQAADAAAPALPAPHRAKALQERVRLLEQQQQQQEQRLKGYVPHAAPLPSSPSSSHAPDGTLLHRLEVLEQGMDVLLRAQELAWHESSKQSKRKARACCCIM